MNRMICVRLKVAAWFATGFFLLSSGWAGGAIEPLNDILPADAKSEIGIASYYADKYHGKPTASGEPFDMHALTAAHPTFKFGTRVKVTHLGNKRSVIVRINDRGPFAKGRVIDLSLAAAEKLQMIDSGLAEVRLEILTQ